MILRLEVIKNWILVALLGTVGWLLYSLKVNQEKVKSLNAELNISKTKNKSTNIDSDNKKIQEKVTALKTKQYKPTDKSASEYWNELYK
jgi:hypothetical protein